MTGKESTDEDGGKQRFPPPVEPPHLITRETRKPNIVAKVQGLEMTEKRLAGRKDVRSGGKPEWCALLTWAWRH